MVFADRADGGRQLAGRLAHLRGDGAVVLGLPRGGVPVAAQVAGALGAPLDVVVARKLGVPGQPELGMGAVAEDRVLVICQDVIARADVSYSQFAAAVAREQAQVETLAARYRAGRPHRLLAGRVAVVVDDGVATGVTARAACQVARERRAGRVVLAVPAAVAGWEDRVGADADEKVCVEAGTGPQSVGQFYRDFGQVPEQDVVACLAR